MVKESLTQWRYKEFNSNGGCGILIVWHVELDKISIVLFVAVVRIKNVCE